MELGFVSAATLLQVLGAVPLDGRPVRFGMPVPAAIVRRGLGLDGPGVLQWRRLPIGGADPDPVWIEVALLGPPGRVRLLPGDLGPCADGRGPAFVHERTQQVGVDGPSSLERWRWADGTVDERRRERVDLGAVIAGERYLPGEWRCTQSGLGQRARVVVDLPGFGERVGLLPARGAGAVPRRVRRQLEAAAAALPELPGARGAGDYGRSGGVVTNLEFDTTLALAKAALGLGDADCWQRACRAARHLLDHDLDEHLGLPFPHGPEHRTGEPEVGHAWLQGLLWVGLLTADDDCIGAARSIGRAIAASPPRGTGSNERLREHAWPLLELEALLRHDPDPGLRRVADAYAASIVRRFDPVLTTFRFGEGEVGDGVYLERAWLTCGLLLPALTAHLQRCPDAALAAKVAAVQAAFADRLGRGGPGLPTHWRVAGGEPFAEHREVGSASAAAMLDGLTRNDQRRLLSRLLVQRAVLDTPPLDDADLATSFTLLARCDWVWR
ncbi:MAG: hypothetical protein JNN13_14050 [Planctomycetes bacterium]|nr:hypothetical protein [Planctomycetota bacterium]